MRPRFCNGLCGYGYQSWYPRVRERERERGCAFFSFFLSKGERRRNVCLIFICNAASFAIMKLFQVATLVIYKSRYVNCFLTCHFYLCMHVDNGIYIKSPQVIYIDKQVHPPGKYHTSGNIHMSNILYPLCHLQLSSLISFLICTTHVTFFFSAPKML